MAAHVPQCPGVDKLMDASEVRAVGLRALLWLPLSFFIWFAFSSPLIWPVVQMAKLALLSVWPSLFSDVVQNGHSMEVTTRILVNQVAPDGRYLSTKTGRMVKRESGPIVQPTDGVHVGVAAEYGIYPELENSYLYRAIEQVAGRQAEDAMAGLGTGIIVGDDEE